MPLCKRLREVVSAPSSAGELLSLMGGVQRLDTGVHVAYLIECLACGHNTIHRIDVPMEEVDSASHLPPWTEFYSWVLRGHS